jgi:hypothetical protein
MVLAARVGIRGRELGITECTYEGQDPTRDPNPDEPFDTGGVLSHELRCAKNAYTNHQADDESDGIECCKVGPGGHAERVLHWIV